MTTHAHPINLKAARKKVSRLKGLSAYMILYSCMVVTMVGVMVVTMVGVMVDSIYQNIDDRI